MVKCGVFVTAERGRGAARFVATAAFSRITKPFMNVMSRRTAPGPSLEIIPRDRLLRRADPRANHGSIEAQQLGPRLQRLYCPASSQHPDDIRTLIVAL